MLKLWNLATALAMKPVRCLGKAIIALSIPALLGTSGPAAAEYIHIGSGNYSYQITPLNFTSTPQACGGSADPHPCDPMSVSPISGAVLNFSGAYLDGFWQPGVSDETNALLNYRSYAGSLRIDFLADDGYSFDRYTLGGRGGNYRHDSNFNDSGFSGGEIDWSLSAGTYTGQLNGPADWRTYAITSPSTGSMSYNNASFGVDGFHDFNNALSIDGYYSIGVAQFSVDISMFAYSVRGGTLGPPGLAMALTTVDAPIVLDGVPAPGALALLCLGLFGVGGMRRKLKAA